MKILNNMWTHSHNKPSTQNPSHTLEVLIIIETMREALRVKSVIPFFFMQFYCITLSIILEFVQVL